MKLRKALLAFTLFASASSNIALAGGFPTPKLPDLTLRAFVNTVRWSEKFTASYKFTTMGFTQAQTDKIKRSMDLMYDVLRDPDNTLNSGPTSDFQQCILDHATRYENPNWLAAGLDERRYAVAIISAMMVASAGKINMIDAFTESKPSDGRDFVRSGYAEVGTVKGGMNTVIHLNTEIVDRRTEASLAGVIMHEMMHNEGWNHPSTGKGNTDYPGTFIKESEVCLRDHIDAGLTPKGLIVSDSINFQAE